MKSIFKKTYDDWKKIYSYFWGDPLDFRFLVVIEINKVISERVLDIGCSVGVTVNASNSQNRIGIDIDINALQKGKKIYPETEFIAASGDALPFQRNSFDLIISVHTLDTDPLNSEIMISEISRVIEKNGEIVLSGNWYHDEYVSKVTSSLKISGSWIEKLNDYFDYNVKWYVRPDGKNNQSKIRRKLIETLPDFALKKMDLDQWFFDNFIESEKPLEMEPYLVRGNKKLANEAK